MSVIIPFLYESLIALIPLGMLFDIIIISCPAKKAVKSIFSAFEYSVTPFIFIASVTIKPLKSSSSFNIF